MRPRPTIGAYVDAGRVERPKFRADAITELGEGTFNDEIVDRSVVALEERCGFLHEIGHLLDPVALGGIERRRRHGSPVDFDDERAAFRQIHDPNPRRVLLRFRHK